MLTAQTTDRATGLSPHARNVALVVATALFMQLLDGVIIVTALPKMAEAFHVNTLAMSVGITTYMLAAAVVIPASTWAADRFGARRVFLSSILAFCLASIGCALAPSLTLFVVARAVQGAGGSMMVPVGRLLVLHSARKSEIVPAIGLIVWPALFAPVLGPTIGGFLTTYAAWQWNFWINVPLGIAGLVLVLVIIPRDGDYRARPFDWAGFLLCAVALTALLYGFDALTSASLPVVDAAVLLAGGLACALGAAFWLPRQTHPLLDIAVLKVRTFLAAEGTAGWVLRVSINAPPFLLPLLFQVVFGLDPLQSGGLVMVYFLGNLVMKSTTTRMLRWFGFHRILVINGAIAGIAIASCCLLASATPYPVVAAVLFVAGLTRSMQFTALQTLAFSDVPSEHRSSASTLSTMFQQIAVVFSVGLSAAVLNASRVLHGGQLSRLDFCVAFLVMGALTVIASLSLSRLPNDVGAEVSGHLPRTIQ
jgi:EmrB/QacA subfamily drug resistance transporter